MIQRVTNLFIPKTRKLSRVNDDDPVLNHCRCQRMIEQYAKENLPDTKAIAIIWLDKDDMLSSAYCNMSPMHRLWLLALAWIQELFDFKVKGNGQK